MKNTYLPPNLIACNGHIPGALDLEREHPPYGTTEYRTLMAARARARSEQGFNLASMRGDLAAMKAYQADLKPFYGLHTSTAKDYTRADLPIGVGCVPAA